VEVGLGPGDFVLDGDPAPLPKRDQIFGPCLLWPNGWMDEAGTWHGGRPQPGNFVLDGDPVSFPQKGAEPPPQFSAHFYCGQTYAGIKIQNTTWYGARPRPRRLCVRWGPSCPLPKRGADPPNFRPMFIVTKRLGG